MAKRFNNYTLGVICALLVGIPIGIALLLFGHFLLGSVPAWLFDILFPCLLASQLVSGVGYTQRFVDLLTGEKTLFDIDTTKAFFKRLFTLELWHHLIQRVLNKNIFEVVGLSLGIAAGIALTIFQLVTHVDLPGVDVLHTGLSAIIQFTLNIGSFAGFFSRCGRTFDFTRNNFKDADSIRQGIKSFFQRDDINYVLGITGGVLLGIVFSAVVLSVVGVSVVSTMGGALPIWAGCALFCIGTIGSFASASGYFGRSFDSFLGNRTLFQTIYEFVTKKAKVPERAPQNDRAFEKKLTVVGTVIGVLLAIGLIAGGITALPFFGSGAPAIVAGFTLFAFSVSASAGLANRVGNAIDRWRKKASPANQHNQDHQDNEAVTASVENNGNKQTSESNILASPALSFVRSRSKSVDSLVSSLDPKNEESSASSPAQQLRSQSFSLTGSPLLFSQPSSLKHTQKEPENERPRAEISPSSPTVTM